MIKKDNTYWQEKISVWLQEPVCKIFGLGDNNVVAKEIAGDLIKETYNTEKYKSAKEIASSLASGILSGNTETVDYLKNPVITHPLVKGKSLNLDFSHVKKDILVDEIKNQLKEDIKNLKTEEEKFNYLFFAFQRQLRKNNVGNLGALWDVLPTDVRIPDHPVWHHLGMTTALYSSMKNEKVKDVSFVVYSITPVQEFITRARKLRDHWTGSVLLSYLAFTGIKTVMKTLGPDHILYPSLHNQFFVDEFVKTEFSLESFLQEKENTDLDKLSKNASEIASFPNKFVFLCNKEDVKDICATIETNIKEEWERVGRIVEKWLCEQTGANFTSLWDSQVNDYWKYSWAACGLLNMKDFKTVKDLLSEDKWKVENDTFNTFTQGKGILYGSTHSLVQGILAACKNKSSKIKNSQSGEKCPLCGENEVLHNCKYDGTMKASEYNENITAFWHKIRECTNDRDSYSQTGKHEKLCSICAIKRYLPLIFNRYKNYKDEFLYKTLAKADSFESTTEMATKEYFIQSENYGTLFTENERKILIDNLHENFSDELGDGKNIPTELEKKVKGNKVKLTDKDKYYAVLLMDGDKMGDLINGSTIEASWKDVLHKDMHSKINNKNGLEKNRIMNPALHAMISDSLNSFSRYGVQPVIEKYKGRLIYVGGDDVCAVLPMDNAILAANEIRKAYTLNFAEFTKDGAVEIENFNPQCEKIGIHLGSGAKGISISAGIVIAHHKQPLREVLADAHHMLDGIAKKKAGRNALAIRLKKRSGGDRDIWTTWDDKKIDSFEMVKKAVENETLSTSLLYRLETLEGVFSPIIENFNKNKDTEIAQGQIIKILEYEINHSQTVKDKEELKKLAKALFDICFNLENENNIFNAKSAIIANFMARDKKGGTDNE